MSINVDVGSKITVGLATIARDKNFLIISDKYHEERFVVDPNSKVNLKPTVPLNVPSRITGYLMVEFKNPLVVSGEKSYWVNVPYELKVIVNGNTVGYVTPVNVKYILYGDIVDGIICRYFKSEVYSEAKGDSTVARAMLKFKIKGSKVIRRIVLPAENVKFYVKDDIYYYEVLEVTSEGKIITVTLTGNPPIKKATMVRDGEGKLRAHKASYEMLW